MDLWVLIYSKFSKSCHEILTLIDQNDIGIDFNLLSIDDATMRERIMKDDRFSIKFVPCILIINQLSGIINQYETDKAFELVYNYIKMNQQSIIGQPPMEQQLHIESQFIPEPQTESVQSLPKDTNETHTSILDLEEEEEEVIKKPKIPERQSPGNTMKKRINVAEIMSRSKKEVEVTPNLARPSYSPSGVDITKGPPEPIKSVKSGSPISVAEIMANASKEAKQS